ncbi:MAG: hypothetical protein QXU26_03330 [Thermofilaceae archaeon]
MAQSVDVRSTGRYKYEVSGDKAVVILEALRFLTLDKILGGQVLPCIGVLLYMVDPSIMHLYPSSIRGRYVIMVNDPESKYSRRSIVFMFNENTGKLYVEADLPVERVEEILRRLVSITYTYIQASKVLQRTGRLAKPPEYIETVIEHIESDIVNYGCDAFGYDVIALDPGVVETLLRIVPKLNRIEAKMPKDLVHELEHNKRYGGRPYLGRINGYNVRASYSPFYFDLQVSVALGARRGESQVEPEVDIDVSVFMDSVRVSFRVPYSAPVDAVEAVLDNWCTFVTKVVEEMIEQEYDEDLLRNLEVFRRALEKLCSAST